MAAKKKAKVKRKKTTLGNREVPRREIVPLKAVVQQLLGRIEALEAWKDRHDDLYE